MPKCADQVESIDHHANTYINREIDTTDISLALGMSAVNGSESTIFVGRPYQRHIIPRHVFDQFGVATNANHRGRSWNAITGSRDNPERKLGYINLYAVLDKMREVEQGDRHIWGKTTWNIFADMVNTRLSEDGKPIMIKWDEDIHRWLRVPVPLYRKRAAVEALNVRYDALKAENLTS